jgi:dihydroorotase
VQVFEEEGALDRVEAFTSVTGARFYGVPENTDHIVVQKTVPSDLLNSDGAPWSVPVGDDRVRVFSPEGSSAWDIVGGSRRPTSHARASTG